MAKQEWYYTKMKKWMAKQECEMCNTVQVRSQHKVISFKRIAQQECKRCNIVHFRSQHKISNNQLTSQNISKFRRNISVWETFVRPSGSLTKHRYFKKTANLNHNTVCD